jgi:hypothetical protein
MGIELPDIYETRQAAAMGDAIRAGDTDRAERLRRHLVAEASHDPDDAAGLDEYTALVTAFTSMVAARSRGDHAEADRIARETADRYPRDAIRHMIAMQLLAAGARDGSMPARQYDELRQLLAELGLTEFAGEQFATITRRTD